MVKSYWWWVGGLQDFSVSPSPLGPSGVLGAGWTGWGLGRGVLGTRFWGQGLTTRPGVDKVKPIPLTVHLKFFGWTYSILVSAPVLFGFRSYWDLVEVWPRGFGD